MEPRIPCELVRGYLDFLPHAWNVVIIKEGESLVRMIVDACHPYGIREESDPEYFCRLAFVTAVVVNGIIWVAIIHSLHFRCGKSWKMNSMTIRELFVICLFFDVRV